MLWNVSCVSSPRTFIPSVFLERFDCCECCRAENTVHRTRLKAESFQNLLRALYLVLVHNEVLAVDAARTPAFLCPRFGEQRADGLCGIHGLDPRLPRLQNVHPGPQRSTHPSCATGVQFSNIPGGARGVARLQFPARTLVQCWRIALSAARYQARKPCLVRKRRQLH